MTHHFGRRVRHELDHGDLVGRLRRRLHEEVGALESAVDFEAAEGEIPMVVGVLFSLSPKKARETQGG